MNEARSNLAEAKRAAEQKREPLHLIKTPLEDAQGALQAAHSNVKNKGG
jgi:hypothetical protein